MHQGFRMYYDRNPRLMAIEMASKAALPNQPDLGPIGWAAWLATSMAFNLGFQTKYIMSP